MPFQSTVNIQPAPAIAGDFASANPRSSMLSGAGALVAIAAGVTVGQFAWATAAGVVASKYQAASQVGFVHREQQALITAFIAESGNLVPGGMPVTLMNGGDYWAKFVAGAAIDQKVFAKYADGSCVAGTAGTPPTVAITVDTTNTSPTINVSAVTGFPLAIGQPITGTGIPAGATITAFVTGTGGTGTYTISANATATATGVAMTATTAFETLFKVKSTAASGELAKISTFG